MVARGVLRLVATALVAAIVASGNALAANGPVNTTGTLDGAVFKIDIPANWNGDLVLYSHGYVVPGMPNPTRDVGDPITGGYLLSQGYALAGSAYKSTGWAIQDALHDQIALLDHFDKTYGKPNRTIAWGHSLGGMITAGLVQRNPGRFAGALPMCGVLAGGVAVWNEGLDAEFVFKTLLAPNSGLQLVHIANPSANLIQAKTILAAAQQTPQGQARLALVSAVGDEPGWFSPLSPEPAANQFQAREANQFLWTSQVNFPFLFALRAELEFRAGGNPSWNTNVDYRKQLDRSINHDEVKALYEAAGLSLEDDLDTLEGAARISADQAAVDYLIQNIVFDGDIGSVPVLTLHTTGDGLVLNQDEQAYASTVDNPNLLRQNFVHRAGHCTFTPAETLAAFNALVRRIHEDHWSGLDPTDLNAASTALGPRFNVFFAGATPVPMPPAYLSFKPTKFLRPFSVEK